MIDEKQLLEDYNTSLGLDGICKKYHIGKLRAKEIIEKNGGSIRNPSSGKIRAKAVDSWRIEKYPTVSGYHYVAKSKIDDYTSLDYMNKGGFLTSHIKEKLGIEKPTLYARRKYYEETGNYWWEQWFEIISEPDAETKKCPYCEWETIDIENRGGCFSEHIKNVHGLTPEQHLEKYPEDEKYFTDFVKKVKKKEKLKQSGFYVICPICGKRFEKITESHLKTHGITMEKFREKYPDHEILSKNMMDETVEACRLGNLSVSKSRFVSKYERELQAFLTENGVAFKTNRQILSGREIDMLLDDQKIGIEFDGLKWHTEWFGGKSHKYHLEKTKVCNEHGYGLIHIFEDEYVNHKDIVLSKIRHIIGKDYDLPKIMGRKCKIKEIYKHDAQMFLEKYHIQGFASSSLYLGAFLDDELVAVMSFKNGNVRNPDWELTRFATSYNYRYQGVASKMFSYFVKNYRPEKVISFADRRWTTDYKVNIYTRLGFVFDKFTPPDYKYYLDESKNGQKYKRIHKMSMSKKTLARKYGFPLTMTETEMAKALGYDRIWDCGLIKYVWTKENSIK